jgi:ABC-2 type transport system ATP-binding protein
MQQYKTVSGFTITLRNPPPLGELQAIAGISGVEPLSATRFRVLHQPNANPSAMLLNLAALHDWQLEQLTPLQATLEDVFAKITEEDPPPATQQDTPPSRGDAP